ncbi:tail tape measure protein TP901 core region [Cupriavidus basilensis OR16]|uniref:Tail tape measure protein TP901 core region n=1 Tax=Cupriavidus basilensis OR16 TaxID=1127483 RepID=H1SDH5_9BURK|nr:phage tail tape measure protein [Cupriavidus basilensis]EHP39429.1 tail tape measure protein TP901 core region [Cupriavidus basilensis OR16]
MSSKQLDLALVLALKDSASGQLSKNLNQVADSARKLATQADTLEKGFDGVSRSIQGVAEAGRILGSRPIPQTLTQYFRQVVREANLAERSIRAIGTTLGRGFQIGGAFKAGQMVLADPIQRAANYGVTLAHMANTAYAGRPLEERKAGMRFLNEAIEKSVRVGGGTREGAAETMDSLIARNAIGSPKDVAALMPTIMMAATAGKADPIEIGKIVSTAVKTGGIKVGEIPDVLGGALYAGQQGGFELKDMAKWLPEQMAMAKKAGLTNKSGMAKMLALNELSIDAAGSTDAAGNNVRDFLHELNATNTANHLKRFSIDKKSGRILEKSGHSRGGDHIDLGATLAANAEKGISADDTMISLVRNIAESNPKFQAIKKKYLASKASGDKSGATENYQAAYDILLGAGVGKIFHNQQALLGGIGAIMDPEGYRNMVKQFRENMTDLPIRDNMALIQDTAGFKMQQFENERQFAQQAALDKLTPALGTLADKATELYQKYPGYSAAIEGATLGRANGACGGSWHGRTGRRSDPRRSAPGRCRWGCRRGRSRWCSCRRRGRGRRWGQCRMDGPHATVVG